MIIELTKARMIIELTENVVAGSATSSTGGPTASVVYEVPRELRDEGSSRPVSNM
jgi:hypothetical protein